MKIDPACLPPIFDADKAETALSEFEKQVTANGGTENLHHLKDHGGNALLKCLAGNSPYLARTIRGHPNFALTAMVSDPTVLVDEIRSQISADLPEEKSTDRLMSRLRIAKNQIAFIVAAADVARIWDLEKVTAVLSDFADLSLQLATAHLLLLRMRSGELGWPDTERERADPEIAEESGLFVLGLGKLGGRELNYSSDIDLIVLYDGDLVEYSGKRSAGDCFVRLTKDLIRIMEYRTRDGYVFRTDMRLRPDPGATPLALSVEAAETYYQSVAQNWERSAMIKARCVAGDIRTGERYLADIAPWVWRKSLDFAALEDIHSIKNQIHRHHGHRSGEIRGMDIKIGPGGIREIEFYAQINQLLYGGRDPKLRSRQTLSALDALAHDGWIKPQVRTDLQIAYRFLRTVEHRLQMINDEQTHQLPKKDEELRRIACFMGFDSTPAFTSQLDDQIRRVQSHYDQLLPNAPEESPSPLGTEQLRELGFSDPDKAESLIEIWQRGRYRATRTERAQRILTQLLPRLLEALGETQDPDYALARFDRFLSNLPSGVQLFSLFQSYPGLLALIARIMGVAPALAEQLSKRPALLDVVLDPGFFDPLPDGESLRTELNDAIARTADYQDALDASRRWLGEKHFQLGVHMLEALIDIRTLSETLTELADVEVRSILGSVKANYAERYGAFPGGDLALVAMGKYGGQELSFGSDLDLILVYDVEGDAEQSTGPRKIGPSRYFSGLGQQLITAITAMTAEGRLYEVDTRLRPSGRAGPLVVSVETFEEYYAKAAWTWEHMALTRARVVSAPRLLRQRINRAISNVLALGRDSAGLLTAVADMRAKIDNEYGTDNPWSVKNVRGGLVDLEFICQYLLLREGQRTLSIFVPRLDDAITRLRRIDALSKDEARILRDGHGLLHAVQSVLRLCFRDEVVEDDFSKELREILTRASGRDSFDQLRRDLVDTEKSILEIYRKNVSDPAKRIAKANSAQNGGGAEKEHDDER